MLGQLKSYWQSVIERGTQRAMVNSAPEQEDFLDQFANSLCRRGLRIPALIALEAGQPVAFIGGQLLWISQPVLALFISAQKIGQAAQVLEDPKAINALISRLEVSEF